MTRKLEKVMQKSWHKKNPDPTSHELDDDNMNLYQEMIGFFDGPFSQVDKKLQQRFYCWQDTYPQPVSAI